MWKTSIWFLIVSVASVILFRWIPIPVTPLMLIRCCEQAYDNKRDVRLKKDWVSLNQTPNSMQLAVVCSEDQNFLEHHGFDFEAIDEAVDFNKTHKRKRGASTISQQTAKNVFLWPGRSWIRKGFEVYFTFLIETVWSKERIMEVYLNVIETGDGIYGVEASAQNYFKKPASKLNGAQAALIAAVLPNPLKFSVTKPSGYISERQSWILNQMDLWGGKLNY